MNKNLLTKLKLWLSPMIGEASFYKISNFYKNDLEDVFSENKTFPLELKISDNLKNFLLKNRKTKILDKLLEKELEFLEKNKINLIDIDSSNYPFLLKNIYNPPPLLFVKGNVKSLSNKCIAIVGTRFPTYYGRDVTTMLAKELSMQNITIVSGLAKGIDAYSHIGVLENSGSTIGVIGSGFKYQYPLENKNLYDAILENKKSAIVTEFPFEKFPDKKNFPIRNRIISGLASGVIIVEANEKSGSLITAMHALNQNRNVYSVPGEITNPKSRGTNKLIKDGAKLITCTEDILGDMFDLELNFSKSLGKENKPENKSISFENKLDEKIYNLILSKKLIQFDEIVENIENDIAEIMDSLFNLIINNFIDEKPGKYYSIF